MINASAFFNQRHSDVQFQEGEEVFIDCAHLEHYPDAHNSQLDRKLRTKFSGPYKIVAVHSPVNYELAMPTMFKGHPAFHISSLRLKRSISDSYFTPLNIEVPLKRYKDSSELVEITSIIGHRRKGRGYVLTAVGLPTKDYPNGEANEFAASALAKTAPDLVTDYARTHNLPRILALCSKTSRSD